MEQSALRYIAQTDTGRRYTHNEDSFALPEPNEKYGIFEIDTVTQGSLFVLCDGIGGASAGEVASELVSNWLVRDYYTSPPSENPNALIKDIILEINT